MCIMNKRYRPIHLEVVIHDVFDHLPNIYIKQLLNV